MNILQKLSKSDEIIRLKNEIKQKDKLLQDKNSEVVNCLYTVTHELRKPVFTICGYANILQDFYGDELTDDVKKYLKRIVTNINQLDVLVDDLMNFARISVVKDECSYININSIIEIAISELNYIMADKKVNLEINKNFPSVFCHKNLMICVYSNLLTNAIKYSKKNEKVNISIGYQDDEIFHKFYVSDNGMGIPNSQKNKLFKLFSRVNDSSDIKGSGLGLAITKRIIEGHGGEIWAESTYRKGTTFYFTIPR